MKETDQQSSNKIPVQEHPRFVLIGVAFFIAAIPTIFTILLWIAFARQADELVNVLWTTFMYFGVIYVLYPVAFILGVIALIKHRRTTGRRRVLMISFLIACGLIILLLLGIGYVFVNWGPD